MSTKTGTSERSTGLLEGSPAGPGLVVVTDNPLLVGAIRAGLSDSRLRLLGYLDPQRSTAEAVCSTGAQVVLVDESGDPGQAIELLRVLGDGEEEVHLVLLALEMDGELPARAFEAGAASVILKSIHPAALATFLEAALSGNIIHSAGRLADLTRGAPGASSEEESCPLTPRELGILQLVASGSSNHEIAQHLWITRQTVKFHLSNIYRKLGVSNRTGACRYAHVNGMMAAPMTVPQEAVRIAS